eukprot:PITA_15816
MIQENKVGIQEFQKLIKTQNNFEGTASDSIGASGGIGTLWNKRKWELIKLKLNNWWVRTDLKDKKTNEEYTIINIYFPNHYRDKALCWESVKNEAQDRQGSKLVIRGDINMILNIEEKLGRNYFNNPSRTALEDLIEEYKLLDIPPSNGKFTWSNKIIRAHNIQERIDRILIQENLAAGYSSIKSKIVHTSASNHKLVALSLDSLENHGPIPFKYNKIWDNKEDFRKLIKESWETENRQEEEEIRQKSRCIWLKAGDKNTAFFHNNLKIRRVGNQIDKIQVDGKEIKEREKIKEAAHNYFKNLLSAGDQRVDSIDFLQQINSKINEQQNSELEKEVTNEEIREATWSMRPDKAPGPDQSISMP